MHKHPPPPFFFSRQGPPLDSPDQKTSLGGISANATGYPSPHPIPHDITPIRLSLTRRGDPDPPTQKS